MLCLKGNMFRKFKGIKLSYDRQGIIFFTLKNYNRLPKETQKKIIELCKQAAGDTWRELFMLVCKNETVQSVSMKTYLNEKHLQRARARLYYLADKEL